MNLNELTPAGGKSSVAQSSPEKGTTALLPRLARAVSPENLPAPRELAELSLVKWPFLLGDAVLLIVAYVIFRQTPGPLVFWQVGLAVLCVAGGASLGIAPFLLEYRMAGKLREDRERAKTLDELQRLEGVIAQVTTATGQWQKVQDEFGRTAVAAKASAEQISAGVQDFTKLRQSINDSEKAGLRLEVEEHRRLEDDCLQALVRVLDHVYALHVGALRSGQAELIEQVSHFQDACRESARRMGLTPIIAGPTEPFDPQRHQNFDKQGPVPDQSKVAETIAPGYTFKGRLLRPASVRLLSNDAADGSAGQTERERNPSGEA